MSGQRRGHALVRALLAAGGEVEQVRGDVRVRLPVGIVPDDRPLLRWVVRQVVTSETFDTTSEPSTRRRRRRTPP